MTYREWKYWVRFLPFYKKWFIILILIRPIIDSFYQLKEVSPLSSPLYIVGVLTPILVSYSFVIGRKDPPFLGSLAFILFSFFLTINSFSFFIQYPTLQMFGNILKFVMPVILFFYIKAYFKYENDLNGILFTFIISSLIPFTVLLYEYLFSPIAPELLSVSRGGGNRFRGLFADSFSYSIYLIGALYSTLFFYLKKSSKRLKKDHYLLVLVIALVLLGLISIKHTASWMVFFALIVLFFMVQLKSIKGFAFAILFFLIILPIAGQYIYETQINPLIAKEFYVIEGDAPIERSFNGRMTRWVNYYDWWKEMNSFSQWTGISTSGHPKSTIMVGGNAHNDFIRIFLLSGLPGLLAYFIFLFRILKTGLLQKKENSFLLVGVFLIIVLYSITAMPTLYVSLLYLIIPVFIYGLKINYESNAKTIKKYNTNIRKIASPIHGPGYSHRNNNKFPFKRRF